MTEPTRHDWPRLIAELEAAGVSAYKIGTMMHRQLVQVQRWKDGSEPRHFEGEMLLAIHSEYVTGVTVSSSKAANNGV